MLNLVGSIMVTFDFKFKFASLLWQPLANTTRIDFTTPVSKCSFCSAKLPSALVKLTNMKLCDSRSYLTAPPAPKMPPGLVELMEGLTKEILRNNPSEVYEFCAQHMRKLLELRDGDPAKKCLTLEQKVAKATSIIKQRAENRRLKYDNDMQMLKQTGELTRTPEKDGCETESLYVKETNIKDENALNSNSKSGDENINNATAIETKVNEDQEMFVDKSSDNSEQQVNPNSNTGKDLNNYPINTVQCVSHTNINEGTEIASTIAIMTNEADQEELSKETDSITMITSEIESNDVHDVNKVATAEKVNQQEDIQNQFNNKHADINDKDLTVKIDIDKHEEGEHDKLTGTITLNESGTALESKGSDFVEQYINQSLVPNKETCTNDENEQNGIQENAFIGDKDDEIQAKEQTVNIDNTDQKEMEEKNTGDIKNGQNKIKEECDTLKPFEKLNIDKNKLIDEIKLESENEIKGKTVDGGHLKVTEIIANDIISDLEMENLERNKSIIATNSKELDQDNSDVESTQVGEANEKSENEINIDEDKESVNEEKNGDHNGEVRSQIMKEKEPELSPKDIDYNTDSASANQCVETKIDTADLETPSTIPMEKLDNATEMKINNNTDEKPLIINIEYERNEDNLNEPNDLSEVKKVDDTINNSNESDAIKSGKAETVDSKVSRTMDLETAAVTIQKVFRNFLFRSKTSSFDDSTNIEFNIFDHESDPKDTTGYSNQPQILKSDKRTHGISRMDTVLQTVNEEKSLSLSTDDSSTLSSAATVIQAHIRGFLVRNRLNRNKTTSSTSLADSDDPSAYFEADPDPTKSKTVLNIHIVPEGGHFLSRDESMLTSVELSLDGSPPASTNLHPLGYDKSERRKQLKREDAIQSVSPPSNNSTRLSEEHDSVKEVLIIDDINEAKETVDAELPLQSNATQDNDNLSKDTVEEKRTDNQNNDNLSKVTVEEKRTDNQDNDNLSKVTVEEKRTENQNLMSTSDKKDDDRDVITPFENVEEQNDSGLELNKLLHSGEFHDVVLPTKVSRNDTSVVRGE